MLDKTGTITEGKMELVEVAALNGATRAEILRLAGAVEAASEHPIALAIAKAAKAEVGTLPPVEGFRNLPGTGVRGLVDGHQVEVGRRDGKITVAWTAKPARPWSYATPSRQRARRRSASSSSSA